MSGDLGEFITHVIIAGLPIHIAVTVISAAIGVGVWSASALEKYADSHQPDENTQ